MKRLFNHHVGMSVTDYVNRVRVALARELVMGARLGMEQVAERAVAMRLALFLVLLLAASPARAHHETAGDTAGLAIPSITHGQMAVIARHRGEILALADREGFQDQVLRRLRNFVDIEYMACAWGLMPESVSDEASPFNECSHAYLSGVQAVLLHLTRLPGDQAAAIRLGDRINLEMLNENSALTLCSFSEEPFNTADTVVPHWDGLLRHGPTCAALLGVAALLAGAVAAVRALFRRARPSASLPAR